MLPDNMPESGPKLPASNQSEVEPVSPEEADAILQRTLEPYLADGWVILHEGAYSARLTRGIRNLDIHVDLLGEVTITETGLTPLQESGRLMAWMVLLAMLLVALAVFSALGIL